MDLEYRVSGEERSALAKLSSAEGKYLSTKMPFPVDIKRPIEERLFTMEDYIYLKVLVDEAQDRLEKLRLYEDSGKEIQEREMAYFSFSEQAGKLLGRFKNTFAQRKKPKEIGK